MTGARSTIRSWGHGPGRQPGTVDLSPTVTAPQRFALALKQPVVEASARRDKEYHCAVYQEAQSPAEERKHKPVLPPLA